MHEFRFNLNQPAEIIASGEKGTVIGRAEYTHGEDQYQIRYCAADGRAVESWWADSALVD